MARHLAALALGFVGLGCGTSAPPAAVPPSDAGVDATTTLIDASAPAADTASEAAAPVAELSALTTSIGTLNPPFSPSTLAYSVAVHDSFNLVPFTVTPTAAGAGAVVTIDGVVAASGSPSSPLALAPSMEKTIRITVTSGPSAQTYVLHVANTPAYDFVQASNVNEWFTRFGVNVALDGDTLAAGAPDENSKSTGIDGDSTDTSLPEAGAAYVLRRSGSTWKHEAYVKASNTAKGAHFGASVALSGDTLVVGAPDDASATADDPSDTSAAGAGAVFVFTRSGTTWTQQAYLKASTTRGKMAFGTSLALAGDTLVVGAPGESSGIPGDPSNTASPNAGAAYVFTRSGTTWTQSAYLKASNTHPSPPPRPPTPPGRGPRPDAGAVARTNGVVLFGQSVAIAGDAIAVGCPGEESNATGIDGDQNDLSLIGAGAVYVFTRSGTGAWTQEAYVKASNTSADSDFGGSVAISGTTLAVGAWGESAGQSTLSTSYAIGAVYVFSRAGSTWKQDAMLRASNPSRYARFGVSTALAGDVLAVGAAGESSGASGIDADQSDTSADGAGAVYMFTRGAGTWTQSAYVKASDAHASGAFGQSVAISGGLLAVGAPDGLSVPRANGVYLVQ